MVIWLAMALFGTIARRLSVADLEGPTREKRAAGDEASEPVLRRQSDDSAADSRSDHTPPSYCTLQ